jgi:hypothetical protein
MASLGVVAYRRLAIFNNPKDISASSIPKPQAPLEGVGWLLACAWLAVGLALVGLAIDLGLSSQRPDIAAKLLRFYWFRWADVMVPLASSLAIWKCIDIAQSRRATIGWHWLPTLLAASATLFPLGLLLLERGSQLIPPADRLIVESTGSVDIATPDRYLDWLAVCAWIEQNTPTDSLWLTPKYQQSFKWHAGRAEIVCWKDVPQDNAAVIEWYQRVQRCEPPRNAEGTIREWTTEEILDLADDYHFQWILIDKTFQQNPLGLEIAYPVTERGFYPVNRSFAVFHIPESMMPRGPESRGSGAF